MKKTFIFYNDRQDYTQEMTLEEKGLFLECILNYQNGLEVKPKHLKFIRTRVKKQLDQDNNKRSEEIDKRKLAGRKGGLAKASKTKQVLASATSSKHIVADNVNVNVNDNVNDIYKKYKKDLDLLVEGWNKIDLGKQGSKMVKPLPKVEAVNESLKKVFFAKRKEYSIENIKTGINKYCNDILKRKPRDKNDTYPDHRFTLFKFLKQSNGLDEFINH